jgi:hypothetical protein
MDTLARDFGIVVVLLVALVVWNVYRATRARERRRRQAEAVPTIAPAPPATATMRAGTATVPAGWTGPGTAPPGGQMVQEYVQQTVRHLRRLDVEQLAHDGAGTDGTPSFEDVYTGLTENHVWYLGNASVAGTSDGSVCTVSLADALPPLWIGPRDRTSSVPVLLKEVTLESEDFDRRYRVQALDRKYAFDMVSPRVMELVMQRDDWTFFLAFSTLVCVCAEPFPDVAAMQDRLAVVLGLVAMVPSFVDADRGAHLPTLPDGTVLDLTDPASRDAVEAALAAMTPQEREHAVQQVQEQGLRFVAGMFGKDLPPDKLAELQRRLEERHHQDG